MSYVAVSYVVIAKYGNGLSSNTDERLEKAAGKRADGSGYDLLSRKRDISWSFRNGDRAALAARAVRKALRRGKVRLYRVTLDKGYESITVWGKIGGGPAVTVKLTAKGRRAAAALLERADEARCQHPSVVKLGKPGRLYTCVDCGGDVRVPK